MQAPVQAVDCSNLFDQNACLTVGVVSDSHIPFRLAALPAAVLAELTGAHMILHAGDLEDVRLIDRFAKIAPTFAVRGNIHWTYAQGIHDMDLPAAITIDAGPHRIWLTHGDLNFGFTLRDKLVVVARSRLSRKRMTRSAAFAEVNRRISRRLERRMPAKTTIVVFGHTHCPLAETRNGTLFFNPGAVVGAEHGLAQPSMGALNLLADGRVIARHIALDAKA